MGSKKGGGGGGYAPPAPQSNYTPPPEPFALDIDRWRGVMGPTPTPNTFTAQGKPPWMQGWFDMPTWRTMAADPSRMLTQQDLMVGRTDLPPPSAPAPMPL